MALKTAIDELEVVYKRCRELYETKEPPYASTRHWDKSTWQTLREAESFIFNHRRSEDELIKAAALKKDYLEWLCKQLEHNPNKVILNWN